MKTLIRTLLTISCLFLIMLTANATHNRAGEITFRQVGPLTFEVTCTTYTKTSSVPADRDSLEFNWGDGSNEFVMRTNGNGNGEPLPNDVKFNLYKALHTYAGRGEYIIYMTDPNRNGGILNANPPNSDQVPFHIETMLKILQPSFQGTNNSPILLQPPIDIAYQGQVFQHTPNAFDIDGDSIAYELIVPLQGPGTPVTNYTYPHDYDNQLFSFSKTTGEYTWTTPQTCGEYSLAILIKEYRAGQLISTIIRDMQITVRCLNNRPPVIEQIDEICVIAGETVNFDIVANDLDAGQKVIVTATGGPLIIQNPAQLLGSTTYQTPLTSNQFVWQTNCDHIRRQPYQVVFKAQDDFQGTSGAVDLQVVLITVVGPPPEDVQATAASGTVAITWENPYACDTLNRFDGFSIWRQEGSNPFMIDTCEVGLAGRGYIKIADNIEALAPDGSGRYYYLDTEVETAKFYCYRILGNFSDLNTAGLPANFVESLASDEVCVQLNRDLPLITNVSVNLTDVTTGEMEIRWSKPVAEDLDTIQNPPPYQYVLYRSEGFNVGATTAVITYTANTYWQANDTTFVDTNLDTEGTPYTYEVEFISNGNIMGTGREASSIYLTVLSTDQLNILSWNENVGWENNEYEVYKKLPGQANFNLAATVTAQTYRDDSLTNGLEYCYYIKSIGTYNIPGIADPLLNLSQETCGIPIDTVPPCPPMLSITNDCDVVEPISVDFINNLSWTNPNETCIETNDVFQYNVYYAENPNATFNLIETLNGGADDTLYNHDLGFTVAGCYYLTAIDTIGNESLPSNIICKDNCPDYRLPNVFTPNNDGTNDLFKPFPYRFVDRIEIQIFNRWGGLVFESTNPEIDWDGTNKAGEALGEGAYFYQCKVYELLNDPNAQPILLDGYIQLIRGQ